MTQQTPALWYTVATVLGFIVRSNASSSAHFSGEAPQTPEYGPYLDLLVASDKAADLNLSAKQAAGLPAMITNGPKPRATAKHRVADPVH